MELFSISLEKYIEQLCNPILITQNSKKELRIFISSIPPQVVNNVGTRLRDYFKATSKDVKFIYKVGNTLYKQWLQNAASHEIQLIKKMGTDDWIDKKDQLTYYRNIKLNDQKNETHLIMILIGVDLATDSSSLQDFYRIDPDSIWVSQMKKSFTQWIEQIFEKYNIYSEKEQVKGINHLLTSLYQHSLGNLIRVSSFLESIDYNIMQEANQVLYEMYRSLNFWDLPLLIDIPSRKKKKPYIDTAISFFSYSKYLKRPERIKALKKINLFREKLDKGEIEPEYSEEFYSIDDLLECLTEYIEKNSISTRKRLLQTDFVFIKDKILDIKPQKKKRKTASPKKLNGSPLEIVLTAIWLTLIDYKQDCDKQGAVPSEGLKKITIKALKFCHDFDDKPSTISLLKGCLGGIDEYITANLKLDITSNDITEELSIHSQLCDSNTLESLPLQPAKSNMPNFQFQIIFQAHDDSENFSIKKEFQWQLPDIQPYRNLWNFHKKIYSEISKGLGVLPFLPIFHIPYYEEIFLVADNEEANRLFKLGLSNLSIENLFNAPDIDKHDPFYPDFKDLSFCFVEYIKCNVEEGYFYSLMKAWPKLYENIVKLYEKILSKNEAFNKSTLLPLLYKAFLLLQIPEHDQSFDYWKEYVDSAIITSVHPAAMDMLHHRNAFLFQSLTVKIEEALNDNSRKKITSKQWEGLCDFASIHYPLFGFISNQDKKLDTKIQSMGLLHKFGTPIKIDGILSSKILLKYDAPEDQDMSDKELFKTTKESALITRILKEYTQVHSYALDGISIAVINASNIQASIAGIDSFIENLLKKQKNLDNPPYHLSLTLFIQTGEDQVISRWMEEWRKRWSSVHSNNKFSYYDRCRLSISQRFVRSMKDYLNIITKDNFEIDIAFLSHFIESGQSGNDLLEIEKYKPDFDNPLKYPIVEMPCGKTNNPSTKNQRSRIISNRQFRLATLHSELSANIKKCIGDDHVVISTGDFQPWIQFIDKIHKKASWVACIDPFIDEALIAQDNNKGVCKREIIGFASGLGAHGELNYTISTERSSLHTIEKKIAAQINRLLGPWSQVELNKASHFIVKHSKTLAGLSLVRATAPKDEYVRNLIACGLIRVCLPKPLTEKQLLCDELISLDTFSHWFEDADNGIFPDLMRIVADINKKGIIEISAHIIECKFAKQSVSHIEKAHSQLDYGLRHLIKTFKPRQKLGKNRYDQRYWWAQIQRLIAGKSILAQNGYQQRVMLHAFENLINGYFNITWKASAVTFWTDQEQESFSVNETWHFEYQNQSTNIDAVACGKELIKTICCDDIEKELPIPDSYIEFSIDSIDSDIRKDTTERKHVNYPKGKEDESIIKEKELQHEPINDNGVEEKNKNIENDQDRYSNIPQRIYLGDAISSNGISNRKIYWEFGHKDLTNRHLLIFGKSGTGKTYAIQSILYELGKQNQNSIIVDYTNGFEDDQLEDKIIKFINPEQHRVIIEPLPINPFRKQSNIIKGKAYPEKPSNTANRVMSVFASVYNLGDQQKSVLYNAIKEGLKIYGNNLHIEEFLEILKDYASEKGYKKDIAVSLLSKIEPFVDEEPFKDEKPESWQSFYDDKNHKVNIIQLSGCSKLISTLITEFSLIDFYWFCRSTGNQYQPKVVVLDEIQNLDHNLGNPLANFLTEGRKFGISTILATQTLSNLQSEEKDRLFQAAHKLFFQPATTEIMEYSKILERTTNEKADIWRQRLTKLKKGECYSIGPSLNEKINKLEDNKAFRISITSLEKRVVG